MTTIIVVAYITSTANCATGKTFTIADPNNAVHNQSEPLNIIRNGVLSVLKKQNELSANSGKASLPSANVRLSINSGSILLNAVLNRLNSGKPAAKPIVLIE